MANGVGELVRPEGDAGQVPVLVLSVIRATATLYVG